jgi:hypothetical protein
VSAPSAVLPLEARQAAWDALWRRLLAPLPDDHPTEDEEDGDSDAERVA